MSVASPSSRTWSLPLHWLAHDVAHDADHGRLALFLPVLAAIGIALCVAAPFEPSPWPLVAAAMLSALAAILLGRFARAGLLAAPFAALAALSAGGAALALQSTYFATPVIARAQSVELIGTITASENRGPDRQRVVVEIATSNLRGPVPRKVRLSVRGGEPLQVGATISAKARLFPLRGPVMPGGYDAARRLYFDGVGATGYSYGPPERLSGPPASAPRAIIHRLRVGVEARIAAALEEPSASFATALLVGRRGGMAEADVEALRISGLGHILAISGLHMALVAGSVFAAVRLALALIPGVAIRWPIKKWAAVAGLLAATIYLALSGGAVATVRAYIMLSVALVAILADRPALTMRTVAVAAVIVMAIDPVSVVEPGFQMSFCAVIALVGAYEWWTHKRVKLAIGWARPVATFLTGLAMTSFIAGLATAPASAYHFHRLAPLGLLGNLAAMPVLTFVAMPFGVISLALMPLGLEALPLKVMGGALEVILAIAHKVAEWSGEAGVVGAVPMSAAFLGAAGLLWLAILTARWRVLGLPLILAGCVLATTAPRYDVLVADDGETLAARGPDGRLTLLGDADGFAASIWLKADGDPRPPGDEVAGGRCDGLGCTLPLRDGVLAHVGSPRALVEDCRLAEVVVARIVSSGCASDFVIDRSVLMTSGAIAAWRTEDGWNVDPARPYGHVRPWHVRPTIERR